jgi:hypothetical protein
VCRLEVFLGGLALLDAAAALERVERGVLDDPHQPRAERPHVPEPVEPVERAQERVLGDVLGVLRPDEPRRGAEHDGPVTVDEDPERAQIPRRRPHDE